MLSVGVLNKAMIECKMSDFPRWKVGAVIFKGNRIISSGHNYMGFSSRIHPKYRHNRPTVHAEMSSIIKAGDWDKLHGCSILILRLTNGGKISMAKPCKKCQSLINHVKIKEIYYSNYDGEIVKEKN